MTNAHEGFNPGDPAHIPVWQPKHLREDKNALLIHELEQSVDRVKHAVGRLCMFDAHVFHTTVDNGDTVTLASQVLPRYEDQDDLLRIVFNRYLKDDLTSMDTSTIFSSESYIDFSIDNKSVHTIFGSVDYADHAPLYNEDGTTPAHSWMGEDSKMYIYKGSNAPLVPMPINNYLFGQNSETIVDRMGFAAGLLRSLDMFTLSTEDVRYPTIELE